MQIYLLLLTIALVPSKLVVQNFDAWAITHNFKATRRI
jgi:hypothetical protein